MCYILNFPEPGIVTDIVAIGTTTTLNVTWVIPTGQVQFYTIQLVDNEGVTKNITINKTDTSNYLFENLTPGELYTVRVITQSGLLIQESAVQNATCKSVSWS